MSYNFESWPGKHAVNHGKGYSTHVRFSQTQMYVSTKLMRLDPCKSSDFDMLVDKQKGVFALQFKKEGGKFTLPSMPGQVCMTAFVREHHPVLNKRIHMRWDEKEGAWIGSLDGKPIRENDDGEKQSGNT